MLTKLPSWLTGVKSYVFSATAALVLALCTTIYVQNAKIETKSATIRELNTKLEVSNSSITALTQTLNDTTASLVAIEREEQRVKAEVAANLRRIREQNRSLETMEARLRARPSAPADSPVPEDLLDAWNSL